MTNADARDEGLPSQIRGPANESSAERPIIVVIGMHRSGTSLCAQALSAFGVDMADDAGPGPGNEDGHWERWEIVQLHDRLLASLNRAYGQVGEYHPEHDLALPPGWLAAPATHAIRREIEGFLQARMRPNELFGFKDPRTARFLPLWFQIFARQNLRPRFVICVRNPGDVALSLARRDNIPILAGHYRWLVYNTECFRHVHDDDIVIDYDSWFSNFDATVARLAKFAGQHLTRQAHADALGLVKRRLNHGSGKPAHGVSSRVYRMIAALEQDPAQRPAVDDMVRQFAELQECLPFDAPLSARAEQAAANAQALNEAMQARAALKVECDRLTAHAATAQAQLDLRAAQLAAAEEARVSIKRRATESEKATTTRAQELAHARATVEQLRGELEVTRDAERTARADIDTARAALNRSKPVLGLTSAEATDAPSPAGLGDEVLAFATASLGERETFTAEIDRLTASVAELRKQLHARTTELAESLTSLASVETKAADAEAAVMAHAGELANAVASLRKSAAAFGLTSGHDADAQGLAHLCDEIEKFSATYAQQNRCAPPHATESSRGELSHVPSDIAIRVQDLTRRTAALEAALRLKDLQIARLKSAS